MVTSRFLIDLQGTIATSCAQIDPRSFLSPMSMNVPFRAPSRNLGLAKVPFDSEMKTSLGNANEIGYDAENVTYAYLCHGEIQLSCSSTESALVHQECMFNYGFSDSPTFLHSLWSDEGEDEVAIFPEMSSTATETI